MANAVVISFAFSLRGGSRRARRSAPYLMNGRDRPLGGPTLPGAAEANEGRCSGRSWSTHPRGTSGRARRSAPYLMNGRDRPLGGPTLPGAAKVGASANSFAVRPRGQNGRARRSTPYHFNRPSSTPSTIQNPPSKIQNPPTSLPTATPSRGSGRSVSGPRRRGRSAPAGSRWWHRSERRLEPAATRTGPGSPPPGSGARAPWAISR